MQKSDVHAQWSSRTAFIFAAVGSAVGLGNIWRFPYMAGENGGAAFVIVYIGFVILIGLPVLMAELAIGRRGRMSPINSIRKVAVESGANPRWKWLGWFGSFGGGLGLLSFYGVIAGWVLAYIIKAAVGTFTGIDSAGALAEQNSMEGNAAMMVVWHAVFIGITIFIVARGITAGLEKAVIYLMPILFLLLLVLVGYSMVTGEFLRALNFLFRPDFSAIDGGVVLAALGQALFSLSVTVGTMLAYGAYLSKDVSIHKSAGIIAAADTGVALIAGLAIFPLVFAFFPDAECLEAASAALPACQDIQFAGPGLIFKVLPVAFGQMPGGAVFGTLFFILLGIAALTSSISMLEPAVSFFEEKQGINRWMSAVFAGGLAFLIGLLSVFSFNEWKDVIPLASFGLETIGGNPATFFEIINFTVSNLIMPISGLLLAVFAGWVVMRKSMRQEMGLPEGGIFEIWHVLIKFFCPIALILILFAGLT